MGLISATLVMLLGHPESLASAPNPALTSSQVLQRVLESEDQVSYESTQSVIPQNTVTLEIHLEKHKSRIEYRLPAGRFIITDGKTQYENDPAAKVVRQRTTLWEPLTPAAIIAVVARVQRSYKLNLKPEQMVSGRQCFVLELTPNEPDRNRHTWWIDNKTFLVLQREAANPYSLLRSRSTHSQLVIPVPPAKAAEALKLPPNVPIQKDPTEPTATILAEARRIVPSWAQLPVMETLGRGFEFESALVTTLKSRTPVVNLHYTDGLTGLSLICVQGMSAPSAGKRVPIVGNVQGTIATVGNDFILSWQGQGKTYNLIGDITEGALLDIARRIK